MDSVLGNWPSYDPHNFSQLRPSDPSGSSVSVFFFLRGIKVFENPDKTHPSNANT